MKPHRFDPISFAFGLAFLGVVGLAWLNPVSHLAGDLRWLGAGVLLIVGIAMLLGSRRKNEER